MLIVPAPQQYRRRYGTTICHVLTLRDWVRVCQEPSRMMSAHLPSPRYLYAALHNVNS